MSGGGGLDGDTDGGWLTGSVASSGVVCLGVGDGPLSEPTGGTVTRARTRRRFLEQ